MTIADNIYIILAYDFLRKGEDTLNDFEKLKGIIVEQLGIDEDTITEDTTLEDIGTDSLALVELVMTVEEEFDIEIKDEDMESLKTVGDVLDYIANNR